MVFHRSLCIAALVLLGLLCCDAVFTHQGHSIRDGSHAGRRLLQNSGPDLSTFLMSDQQQQQAQGLPALPGLPGTGPEGMGPGTTAAVLEVKHKHKHVREYALELSADPNGAVTFTASPVKPVLVVEVGPSAAAAAGTIRPPGDVAVAAADGTQQQQQPAGSSSSKGSDGDGDEQSPAGAAAAAAPQPSTPNINNNSTNSSSTSNSTGATPSSSSSSNSMDTTLSGTPLPPASAAQPANLESGTAPALIKGSSSSVGGNGAMFEVGSGGYAYLPPTSSSSSSVPLGMPVTETGLQLSRWVMVAWGVSNFSNPVMLSSDVMREVQTM
jgi:hypothetical protein